MTIVSKLSLHLPYTIHHYETLGSTNDQLKQMLDAPEFTCVTADEQTAGRGRRDRSWHSAPGEGLYLSVLLRPEIKAEKLPLLSLLAAVAVAEAVLLQAESLRPQLDIKWPNDVLVNERKLSGILIESTTVRQEPPRVLVGIGVNLNQQVFPPELSDLATSLQRECGQSFELVSFRNCLLTRLAFWYEELRCQRAHKILQRWQEFSSYAQGKQVVVHFDHEEIRGVTLGITENGALQLRTDSGQVRALLAGEIKHLRHQ
jgi:BirA family transcriptional regulator, biotin operon repressor / biotin---[acetyl-CoA-carboxylase] ligase